VDRALDWSRIGVEAWLGTAGSLVIVLLLAWLGDRLGGRRGRVARVAAAALGLRLLVLGNPIAWQVHARLLGPHDVGWRQDSVIRERRDHDLAVNGETRWLAVGSSQANAVFGPYAEKHDSLDIFAMAAMAPIDFALHEEEILRRRPRTILLYLSDFDLARAPAPESIALAPRQGRHLAAAWRAIGTLAPAAAYRQARRELVAGELLPEVKYGFVLRGLANKILERVARRLAVDDAPPEAHDSRDERLRLLRESLSPEPIDANLGFLREFLAFAGARGARVVIVEGSYHPDVSDDATLAAALRVRQALQALAEELDHVRFLPRSEIGDLGPDSYRDLTHVTPDAGYALTSSILGRLEVEDGETAAR
jgi:hypothetical protein